MDGKQTKMVMVKVKMVVMFGGRGGGFQMVENFGGFFQLHTFHYCFIDSAF